MSPTIPQFKLFDNIQVMDTMFTRRWDYNGRTGIIKEILSNNDYVVQLDHKNILIGGVVTVTLNGCYLRHNPNAKDSTPVMVVPINK